MSHQKVIAEDKWGFYEITDDRIAWLLTALENEKVKENVEHLETYQEILVRWSEDDFSEVDKDHNAVWRLQGGNVGIATGILSKEAEEKYIKKTKEDSH